MSIIEIIKKIFNFIFGKSATVSTPTVEKKQYNQITGPSVIKQITDALPLMEIPKVLETIKTNEESGVYVYTLVTSAGNITIEYGHIKEWVSPQSPDHPKYADTPVEFIAIYTGKVDELKSGFESPLVLHRNTKIICNVKGPEVCNFCLIAKDIANISEACFNNIGGGATQEIKSIPVNPAGPNGWQVGEYDITFTLMNYDKSKEFDRIVIPAKVVYP